MRAAPSDRGSIAIEAVVLVPGLVGLLLLIAAFGVATQARGEVNGAAHDAARAATLQRDSGSARQVAIDVAERTLQANQVDCITVDVFPAAQLVPGADFTVEVICRARLSAIGLVGIPGTVELRAVGRSYVDEFRGVG
jgi:TadE-like protein